VLNPPALYFGGDAKIEPDIEEANTWNSENLYITPKHIRNWSCIGFLSLDDQLDPRTQKNFVQLLKASALFR